MSLSTWRFLVGLNPVGFMESLIAVGFLVSLIDG